MADNVGGPIYGPNFGGRQYIMQLGRAVLAAGTVAITVPRPASTTPLTAPGEVWPFAFKTGTTAAGALGTATFTGGLLRVGSVTVNATTGVITFNITSNDAADTDTVQWVCFMPA